jgi:hypothetical protein
MSLQLAIRVKDADNHLVAETNSLEAAKLQFSRKYQTGDCIYIESNEFPVALSVTLDSTIAPAIIWLTDSYLEYPIPLDEEHEAYPPEAFIGENHIICVKKADDKEWNNYRNISENSLDRRGTTTYYPHCTASVETRRESVFAARNTIDGSFENTSHGQWPYTSWGDNEDPKAQIMIEFGREVIVDKALILLRADFPHDNYWTQAALVFSDGSREPIKLQKTKKRQMFSFSPRKITWVKLTELMKSDEESPFPALSQWALFGRQNDGKYMEI